MEYWTENNYFIFILVYRIVIFRFFLYQPPLLILFYFISFFYFADHAETKPIVSFIGDICEPETIEKAFQGVDCVFHCAAFINFQFPSDLTELERVNVNGKMSLDKLYHACID